MGKQLTLRSVRKPGHFWVDNEVLDCYLDVIGADACWVYCLLARCADGPKVVIGLRELADMSGKSADTGRRMLAVLALVGLVDAAQTGNKRGEYSLCDVKELVMRHGGSYDRESACYRLPGRVSASLRSGVQELRVKLARKQSSASANPVSQRCSGVAQSDAQTVNLFFNDENECDSRVAPLSDSCVAQGSDTLGTPSNTEKLKTENNYSPFIPLVSEGEEIRSGCVLDFAKAKSTAAKAEAGADVSLSPQVDAVMQACGFTARKLRRVLAAQMRLRCDVGETAATVAREMIAAWRRYAIEDRLAVRFAPSVFFGDGYWLDDRRWHWRKDALDEDRMLKLASVGSYREA